MRGLNFRSLHVSDTYHLYFNLSCDVHVGYKPTRCPSIGGRPPPPRLWTHDAPLRCKRPPRTTSNLHSQRPINTNGVFFGGMRVLRLHGPGCGAQQRPVSTCLTKPWNWKSSSMQGYDSYCSMLRVDVPPCKEGTRFFLWRHHLEPLKVLIFASTNFRENLFSREFIFTIWTTFVKYAKISSHEFFENLDRENKFFKVHHPSLTSLPHAGF